MCLILQLRFLNFLYKDCFIKNSAIFGFKASALTVKLITATGQLLSFVIVIGVNMNLNDDDYL